MTFTRLHSEGGQGKRRNNPPLRAERGGEPDVLALVSCSASARRRGGGQEASEENARLYDSVAEEKGREEDTDREKSSISSINLEKKEERNE